MAKHVVTVNKDNVVVGGAEYDTGATVVVSEEEFQALTAAGRFSGGSPTLTAGAAIQEDDVTTQVAPPTAIIAMTSAAAVAAPTKAEYDALRTDVVNTRTYLTALKAALTGAGKPFSS